MKMSGTRQLSASKQQVWDKLNDVDVLKRCIPGCQDLEQVGDDKLKATVGLKVGPINAKFNGDVTLSDMNAPNSYRISGSGKGGAAGSATGGANVSLADNDGGTELSYDVDAKVSGKIAQLGARLIDATAASLANKFFDNLAAEFGPVDATSAAVEPTSTGATTAASSASSSQAAANQGGSSYIWWIIGVIVAAGVVWYLLR